MRQATLVAFYGQKRGPWGICCVPGGTGACGRSADRRGDRLPSLSAGTGPRRYWASRDCRSLPCTTGTCSTSRRVAAMRLPELFGFILGPAPPIRCPVRRFRGPRLSLSQPRRAALRQIVLDPGPDRGRHRLAGARGPRWPLERPGLALILDELRRGRPKVWCPPPLAPSLDVDNDLYLRLGLLDGELADLNASWSSRRCGGRSAHPRLRRCGSDRPISPWWLIRPVRTLPVGRSEVVRLTDPRLRREVSSPNSMPEIWIRIGAAVERIALNRLRAQPPEG